MTETVVNTRTLPVFLAELIPTETLRIARVGREIRLIPVEEVQDVPMQAEETADFRHESEPPKSAMGILHKYARPTNQSAEKTAEISSKLATAESEDGNQTADFFGIFSKYANPSMIPYEKEAWGMVVLEKYGFQRYGLN